MTAAKHTTDLRGLVAVVLLLAARRHQHVGSALGRVQVELALLLILRRLGSLSLSILGSLVLAGSLIAIVLRVAVRLVVVSHLRSNAEGAHKVSFQ